MKNIQGTEENLELFNENGIKVYKYYKDSNGYSCEYTRDSNGNLLTYKNSDGTWYKYTRDSQGKVLTYKHSNGYSCEYTYDSNGNLLTYKNSKGTCCEYTYDSQGKELTFKSSNGVSRGFDKTYTIEEAAEVYANKKGDIPTTKLEDAIFKQGFIDGAKWQSERRYSEEDLLSAFEAGMMFIGEDKGSFKEWFEQFKKKQ